MGIACVATSRGRVSVVVSFLLVGAIVISFWSSYYGASSCEAIELVVFTESNSVKSRIRVASALGDPACAMAIAARVLRTPGSSGEQWRTDEGPSDVDVAVAVIALRSIRSLDSVDGLLQIAEGVRDGREGRYSTESITWTLSREHANCRTESVGSACQALLRRSLGVDHGEDPDAWVQAIRATRVGGGT